MEEGEDKTHVQSTSREASPNPCKQANKHLDTRIKLRVLKSVIVPPLEYAGEVLEGNKKVVKELEAAQMKAAKVILGCSKRATNITRQGRSGDPIPTIGKTRKEAQMPVSAACAGPMDAGTKLKVLEIRTMDSADTPEVSPREGKQFDIGCESYTPQMWMQDLELLRASGANMTDFNALQSAATYNRVDFVQLMLANGYEKDALSDIGFTPLYHAAIMGHMAVTHALLAAGADVNLRSHDNVSPLDVAAVKGHVDVATAIIARGADVNAASTSGNTALHHAAACGKAEAVSLLCLKGADVDGLNRQGRTAIQLAAERGHLAATRSLLDAGADATLRPDDNAGMCALDLAASGGHVDVAEAIIEHGVDVNAAVPNGNTALHIAAIEDEADMVLLLCSKGAGKDSINSQGSTPLQMAAGEGNVAATQALLDAGADASSQSEGEASSALDCAVCQGYTDVVRVKIEHEIDVNISDVDGKTALHHAVAAGKVEMGCTPLHLVAMAGRAAAAQALLDAGADVALRQNGVGLSSLHFAASQGRVDTSRVMAHHGGDVNAKVNNGITALRVASAFDKAPAIDVLTEAGANIEAQANGSTPLHVASQEGRLAAGIALLRHGASVGKKNAAAQTPLHLVAAKAGSPGTAEMVDLLLRRGADETAVSENGHTAADMVVLKTEESDSLAEDVDRVRKLLARAPADRAWRRRGFLILSRAHYPGGRVQFGHRTSQAPAAGVAKRTRSSEEPSRAEIDWAGVVSMLMGDGVDPISLMGDGANLIFEKIVGYL
ncbi:unnamed protein product [Ectocarpus sp. CCAP 1310/34]|nr:unnamed protein product [Ectocarpus sp. CCAP 1310/34]